MFKRIKNILPITTISIVVLLSGCKEEAKTKQWYIDHPDEMTKVYEKCKSSGEESDDCHNATAAHFNVNQNSAPIPDLN